LIYTVTPNPAIDITIYIDTLERGKVNRSRYFLMDAGGKGINVSKVIKILGGKSKVLGFLGKENSSWFTKYLQDMKLDFDFVLVEGFTRTNIKIVEEKDEVYTDLNQNGFEITEKDKNVLLDKLRTLANPNDIFVLSGSLPSGVKADFYVEIIRLLKRKGTVVIFDADGTALKYGLEGNPDILKPNINELQSVLTLNEENPLAIARSAKSLFQKGVKKVLVSMGDKGAVFVTEQISLYSKGIPVEVKSTAGAGDSMVAAISYGLSKGMNDEAIFKLAVACATAKVATEGVKPPIKKDIERFLKKIKLERLVM